MGGAAIAALLKWPAIVAGVLAMLFGLRKLIQRDAEKRATASDDLAESLALTDEQRRQLDVLAQPTPKGRKLLDMIEARRKHAEARRNG